jgi:hypothetical protein
MTDHAPDDTDPRPRRIARSIQHALVAGRLRDDFGAAAATWVEQLGATRMAELVDAEPIRAALTASLDHGMVRGWTLPLCRHAVRLGMARLAARGEPVADFVPPAARQALDQLVARPDVVPPSIVQEVLQDPAVEEVLRDVLFEALRQFSESASPFTADWGLPALLKRLPPFGASPIRKAIESMRADFEKRLEPEIRKFLAGFSKRATRRAADHWLRKQQEPELRALRQRVVSALLKRPLGELSWPPDDPRGELLLEVVVETVGHVLVHEALRQELDELLDRALAAFGDKTVGEALEALGVGLPEVAGVARAYWPLVARTLEGEPFGAALEKAVAAALRDDERA